ncbi:MAG TPA: bifunctional phosphoribosyl-AMP cyclohydrolase/phosphoribosyl-ATP diphosphatase HisIE [Polyangiaceae bacterium]|nr:bifunctional phosphoribosyl-AMP cyclohydrolase/phosphoribosyl-ATP diphosphatase HisIE [Polyangiaceae bacterium]
MNLKFDPQTGLIPAIAQDRLSGELRMVAYMNQLALDQTLRTGFATFFSRSRNSLWVKGETSGNRLKVARVVADCDADVVLLLVDAEGPSCHTGRQNCFFHEVGSDGQLQEQAESCTPTLTELERTILARTRSTGEKSYTRYLLDAGIPKINEKIREEAGELIQALSSESDERVANEAADLLFHMCVGLRSRGVDLAAVLGVLAARTGKSGHEEKRSRKPSPG